MAHHNTVFSQLLKPVPRHEFETLTSRHLDGRKLRKMTRWSQFVAMALAQLSDRSSLRDVVSNLSAQTRKLYHLGAPTVSRSSLARVNEKQPSALYEALFSKLLSRCQGLAPHHGFRFSNKLDSLDASPSTCASVSSPGPSFVPPRVPSNSMSASTMTGCLPHSWRSRWQDP
jgi:putative transposase